ncbi:uncharacterized protein [Diadema antillarum]|uniref:uncharacterized protein n=1 Tax=Diadema antillarum TaxID=105358 RepID=UPI003A87908B
MATNSLPPSYNTATTQQNPVTAPARGFVTAPARGFVTKCFRVTGILHAVAGAICIALGIGTIVVRSNGFFVGIPIWSGLLIFVSTGILGMVYHCKPKNRCIAISYLVMSVISAVLAAAFFFTFIGFATTEYYNCYYGYPYYDYHTSYNCRTPLWVKHLLDGLLALVFFLEIGCGVTSASVACFKVCRCCRPCCKCCEEGPVQETMVYYAPQGSAVPLMHLPANQAGGPIYVAGQSTARGQPGTVMLLTVPHHQAQGYVPMQYAGQVSAGPPGAPQCPAQPASQPPGHSQQAPLPNSGGQILSQQVMQAPLPHQPHPVPPVMPGGMIPVQGGAVQTQLVPAPVPTVQSVPPYLAQGPATKKDWQTGDKPAPGQTGDAKSASAQEQIGETMEEASGELSIGQFDDQNALI